MRGHSVLWDLEGVGLRSAGPTAVQKPVLLHPPPILNIGLTGLRNPGLGCVREGSKTPELGRLVGFMLRKGLLIRNSSLRRVYLRYQRKYFSKQAELALLIPLYCCLCDPAVVNQFGSYTLLNEAAHSCNWYSCMRTPLLRQAAVVSQSADETTLAINKPGKERVRVATGFRFA